MGTISDFLVSTYAGLVASLIILLVGALTGFYILEANKGQTPLPNLITAITFFVGIVLVAFNALMTNPSRGLQLFVSIRFWIDKFKARKILKTTVLLKVFRIWPEDESKTVIEYQHGWNHKYMTIFKVRGNISPISFDDEKAAMATLNKQLLNHIEDDTLIVKSISVERARTQPKRLSKNATPDMIRRRNQQYKITSKKTSNRQVQTDLIVVSSTPTILNARVQTVINAFNQGLVNDYILLNGEVAKKEIAKIYI